MTRQWVRTWWCGALLGALLVACGGPEGMEAEAYGDSAEALSAAPGTGPRVAPAAAPASPASAVDLTVSRASGPVVAPVALTAAGYLVGGDSSPDPIPAHPRAEAGHALPTLADCLAIADPALRDRCLALLGP